ncbi:MAG: DegT/DnrJ/EryC1/StrS family aminotransferase [Thermoguttaceae bacterium]|nr:DegT/DnrJ/EryC1/StrS family aminotransferase [Thermoguttaceae bacterium]
MFPARADWSSGAIPISKVRLTRMTGFPTVRPVPERKTHGVSKADFIVLVCRVLNWLICIAMVPTNLSQGFQVPQISQNIQSAHPIPLLDLGRQHRPIRQQVLEALARVYDSGAFVLGPEVQKLEAAFAQYCQVRHAIGCASGSDALLLALMALDVGPGDEVILPSFTFFSTASAVTRLGARPVFADIDPHSFTIDPQHVAQLITPRTKVLLPVHLFGQCADMEALGRLAAHYGLAIVEDCAQSIGAWWDGKPCGSLGDIGCFSFYPTKNLGGAGDGGMLTTVRDDLAHKLRLLRVHGMEPRYYHKLIGINSRLDSFQAAVLNVKFPYLEQWTACRQTNAARYQELFTQAGLDKILGLPQVQPRCRHVWNQYVIRVPNKQRDRLRQFLAEAKIGTEIYYPLGLHQQECFGFLGYRPGDLPYTERAAQEVLALPIFPELTANEQERIVSAIAAFFEKG